MEELQKFMNEEFDKYKNRVSDWGSNPPEYNEKMEKAKEEIKKYIEEKYPSIIVNNGILKEIKFYRTSCHRAWNTRDRFEREVNAGAIGVDMRRGPWANHDVAVAKENYENSCKKLLSCIEISQKIDFNNIDENVFEELRVQGKISNGSIKVGNENKYVPEDIISFSNPVMQYAYNKYCESKEKEEQIRNLQNGIEERDELISHDTKTIQTLTNITGKYRNALNDDRSTLEQVSKTFQTATTKVVKLKEMYEMESKKSIFTIIKEKIQGLFNKNLMLPEHTNFNESINTVQQHLNNNEKQVSQRLNQIDNDVALSESDKEIKSMMRNRTSMLEAIKKIVNPKFEKENER